MNNYSLYENLNIYFPNEQYENIKNSLDLIQTLASLMNYFIIFDKANHKIKLEEHKFATMYLEHENTGNAIALYLNYDIIDKHCTLSSIELYHKLSNSLQFSKKCQQHGKQPTNTNYKEIFDEAAKLLT